MALLLAVYGQLTRIAVGGDGEPHNQVTSCAALGNLGHHAETAPSRVKGYFQF